MSASKNDIYQALNMFNINQVFTVKIDIKADKLDNMIYDNIKKELLNTYGNKCYNNTYIYLNSIDILKIGNGEDIGCHLKGYMSFIVEFKAQCLLPVKNAKFVIQLEKIDNYGGYCSINSCMIVIPKEIQIKVSQSDDNIPNLEIFKDLKEKDFVSVRIEDFVVINKKIVIFCVILEQIENNLYYKLLVNDKNKEIGEENEIEIINQKDINDIDEPMYVCDSFKLLNMWKNRINPIYKIKNKGDEDDNAWNTSIDKTYLYASVNKYKLAKDTKLISDKIEIFKNVKIISRAFYKMWEIICDYNILNFDHQINVCNIAEGPGGFIQSINIYRKMKNNKLYDIDNYIAITLKNRNNVENKKKNDWTNSTLSVNNSNIFLTYGDTKYNSDNNNQTGNILDPAITNVFINKCRENNKKMHLVTADGGIDVSDDFNSQELQHIPLFYSEIYIALNVQEKGGNFVLKIYDIQYKISYQLLILLTIYYESVIICKPKTSKPANSEKYVVCKNFKGIDDNDMEKLTKIYKIICEKNDKSDSFILSLFDFLNDEEFIEQIKEYNNGFINMQISAISSAIDYYDKNSKDIFKLQVKESTLQLEAYNKWIDTYIINQNKSK